MAERPTQAQYIGGQAVLEGVMMRTPNAFAVALRLPSGRVVVRDDLWRSLWARFAPARWPWLRGGFVLIESLYNGITALNFSAEQAEAAEREASAGEAEADAEAPKAPHPASAVGTMVVSFALAFALFVGLPHLLTMATGYWLDRPLPTDGIAFHAIDGAIKFAIFVGYLGLMARIPEVRRVFEYHGAEHKVVNAYERGTDLDLDAVRPQTTFHARCGTSFLLIVLVSSIVLFALVIPLLPVPQDPAWLRHLAIIFVKLPLLIPLAGIAYEINRFASDRLDRGWVKLLVWPGRMMQSLTTREPDDAQLEIALIAMHAALARESEAEASPAGAPAVARHRPARATRTRAFPGFQEAHQAFLLPTP